MTVSHEREIREAEQSGIIALLVVACFTLALVLLPLV